MATGITSVTQTSARYHIDGPFPSGAVEYHVYRGTGTSRTNQGLIHAGSFLPIDDTFFGLVANTTYSWEIRYVTSTGGFLQRIDYPASFTTLENPPAAPATPNCYASRSGGTANVSWDNVGSTGMQRFRDGAYIGDQNGSFSFSEARGQTTTGYQVRAFNSNNGGTTYSNYSNTASVFTNNPPHTANITKPGNGEATGSTGSLEVRATVSDPDGANCYALFRWSTDPNFGSYTDVNGSTVGSGGTSVATLTGLPVNSTIHLRAHTNDGAEFAGPHQISFITNRPPPVPAVTAPNGGETINTTATVSCSAVSDPDGNALTYDFDLTTNNGSTWASIRSAGAASATYDFTNVPASTTCRVRARSRDSGGLVSAWDESNANFTVQHNRAPTAPTLTSPINNATVDVTAAQRFTFTANDPDPGDSKTKHDIEYRATGTTVATLVSLSSTTGHHDFAANTFTNGTKEWRARTYDALGVVGAWSAWANFSASTPPAGPTITSPLNGATIATANSEVVWSTGAQQAYQVRRLADGAGGVADAAVVYYDSGIVTSTTARNQALTFAVNNRAEHVQVRVQNDNLWSVWVSIRVIVSYTPPAASTIDPVPVPERANIYMAVGIAGNNVLSADTASGEGGIGTWVTASPGTITKVVTAGASDGGSVIAATYTGTGIAAPATDAIAMTVLSHGATTAQPASEGQVWSAAADVRRGATFSAGMEGSIGLQFLDAAGAQVGGTSLAQVSLSDTMQRPSRTATAPAGTTQVRVLGRLVAGAGGSGIKTNDIIWFDRVVLRSGTDSGWQPGSQPAVTGVDVYRRQAGNEASRIRIAANLPAGIFTDWKPASGVAYEYQTVSIGANGTSTTSPYTAQVTVKFRGVWLMDPRTPEDTVHQFQFDGMGRSTNWQPESFKQEFVGRKYPVVEFGSREEFAIEMNLPLDDETGDRPALGVLQTRKTVLLYRDGRGRKAYIHIPNYPVEDTAYGQMFKLSAYQVDYTEAV